MSSASDRTAARRRARRRRRARSGSGAMPGRAGALDVGLGRVADVPGLLRARPGELAARRAKIAPSGLAEPTSAEASAPSTSAVEPGLGQPLVQRPVPVGDDDARGSRARAAPRSVGRAVRVGVEAQRRQQRVEARRRARTAGAIASAQRSAQVVQRLRVAALVQMRPVVGDLGPDRGLRARLADVDARALAAARRAGAAPAARTSSSVPRASKQDGARLGSRGHG